MTIRGSAQDNEDRLVEAVCMLVSRHVQQNLPEGQRGFASKAIVDRNILRLAIFEILLDNKVPVRAAINEAVELAKTFGSENSPKFINGVLGAVSALANR